MPRITRALPALAQITGIATVAVGVGIWFGLGPAVVAAGAGIFLVGLVLDLPARRR